MKYDQLTAYLHTYRRIGTPVRISFQRVQEVLGSELPQSAFKYRAWWSNNGCNNAATQAWLAAGFKTKNVDMDKGEVTFVPDAPHSTNLDVIVDHAIDVLLSDPTVSAALDRYCQDQTDMRGAEEAEENSQGYFDWFEARTYALSELLNDATTLLRPNKR